MHTSVQKEISENNKGPQRGKIHHPFLKAIVNNRVFQSQLETASCMVSLVLLSLMNCNCLEVN